MEARVVTNNLWKFNVSCEVWYGFTKQVILKYKLPFIGVASPSKLQSGREIKSPQFEWHYEKLADVCKIFFPLARCWPVIITQEKMNPPFD